MPAAAYPDAGLRPAPLRAGRGRRRWCPLSPATFEFTVDCGDREALHALCAAPLPTGIDARCVSHLVLRGDGYGRLLRAEIRVRCGIPAGLIAAWLRVRMGGCEAAWRVDGIPVTASPGPRWRAQRSACASAAPSRLATPRA